MTNVTPIESKQPAPATAKFTVGANLDGFPIQVEIVDANADKLRALIDRLKAIGAQPPTLPIGNTAPTNNGAPLCPTHGTPMKASRKPGSYYCPKRSVDGAEYCPEKA